MKHILLLFSVVVLLSLNTNAQTVPWSQDYNGGSLELTGNSQWDGRSVAGHEINGWMDATWNTGFIRTLYINNGEDGYDGNIYPYQAKVVRVLMAPGVTTIQISGTWSHTYSGYTLHGFLNGETGQVGGNTPEYEPGLICIGSCSGTYIDPSTELFLYGSFLDDQKTITRTELGIPIEQPIWVSYVMYQDNATFSNYANTVSFSCNVIGEDNIAVYRAWMQERPWWDSGNSGNTADGIEEYWNGGTVNLNPVGYHVANGELTNTTTEMEYQLGGTKTWTTCSEGTTTNVEFIPGDVEIREIANTDNYRLLTTLTTPDAPEITINFINETTNENITSDIMYSYDLVDVFYGNGSPLELTPGEIVYFKYIATETDLASNIQNLTVPTRPNAPTDPVVNDDENLFGWTNNSSFPNATDYEYTINAGTNWFDCNSNPIYVGDIYIPAGDVQVRIIAITNTNFKSDELMSDMNFTNSTNIENTDNNISIYPNPTSNFIEITAENICSIKIIDISGKIIYSFETTDNSTTIDLSKFEKGIYFVKISTDNSTYSKKIIKL